MLSIIIAVMGGVGLFLLGMGLMTEGLKAMAGDAIKSTLMRFTRSPASGVLTGAVSAGLLQSSSATIIATVGFVGAGLLSYSQALGVVLGASVGTTATGWLVAIVGFKLKFGTLASILILIGALLRLFGGAKQGGLAFALAGFGLIFVGIEALQQGMSSLHGVVNFTGFAGGGMLVRVQLALIGVVFTIITQSSSAGVVAALAALSSGLIDLQQAAALVIGMNAGTTFTSAVATIGGDANVRRTGFSHVLYNLIVGCGALFLVEPYFGLWQALDPALLQHHKEIALVGFHTLFNLVGVLILLPFIGQYARLMERLFPEPVRDCQKILDPKLLKYPELGLSAVHKVLADQAQQLAHQVLYLLGESSRAQPLSDIARQLQHTQQYVDSLHLQPSTAAEWDRLLAAIHLIDHLQRLLDRCQSRTVLLVLRGAAELEQGRNVLRDLVLPFANQKVIDYRQVEFWVDDLKQREEELRQVTSQDIARGRIDLKQGTSTMEAVRWLQRVAVHLSQIEVMSRRLNYQPSPATG